MSSLYELTRERDLTPLVQWLSEARIIDIVEELARLDPADKVVPFRLLDRDRALAVFEGLEPAHQQEILEGLRGDSYRQLVEDMDPDDRVRLVDELPAKVARRVLAGLSPRERALTARLLGYPEDSAGRIMSPEFVNLRESMSVGDALSKVRRSGRDAETVYTLPVTDDARKLVGVVSLRQLVLAQSDQRVGDLMEREVLSARASDDQELAARLIQEADLLALPVLDSEDRLVGVITVDDAIDVLEQEETEDRALTGATVPLGRPYLSASALTIARSRVLWLFILIIAAGFTVTVLDRFEGTLATNVRLALFIPLLIGTGGNTGAQAATVVIRAMALDEIRFTDLPRVVWREARTGVLMGLMLGLVGYFPVAVIFGGDLATVVALSILTICTWATLAGSMLPMLANRVGVDPAVISAPLITTLVDATGLVMYFLIARAVLGI